MKAAAAAVRGMAGGRAWPILAASALAWALVGLGSAGLFLPDVCGDPLIMLGANGAAQLATALELNLRGSLVGGWLIMLAAMMLPLLWLPLSHVWDGSLAARRPRALALFLAGYGAVWLAALALLWPAAILLRLALGGAAAAALAVLGLALLWQGTAAKARLLRRAHELPALPASGLGAELASLRFGAGLGVTCVGACWALMLLPMVAGDYRLALMAACAAAMLAERYAAPPRAALRPAFALAGLGAFALALI
jgi:predicted metal-binding membrane protein